MLQILTSALAFIKETTDLHIHGAKCWEYLFCKGATTRNKLHAASRIFLSRAIIHYSDIMP